MKRLFFASLMVVLPSALAAAQTDPAGSQLLSRSPMGERRDLGERAASIAFPDSGERPTVPIGLIVLPLELRRPTALGVGAGHQLRNRFPSETGNRPIGMEPRPTSFAQLQAQSQKDIRRRRPAWVFPVVGAVTGAGIGALIASYRMNKASDWVAPPLHFIYVPVGGLVGLLVGAIANESGRPRDRG